MSKKIFFLSLLFLVLAFLPLNLPAREQDTAFRSTNFPLPRFVSLNAEEVHVRTGPGQNYPIKWMFKKKLLPVEIILEYDAWRKIKDHEGQVGWIHKSLLSGRRTGFIHSDDLVPVYRKSKAASRLVAYIEPQTIAILEECAGNWCEIEASGYRGWVQRKFIWGVYDGEDF